MIKDFKKGNSLVMVLVFSAVFIIVIGGMVGLAFQQNRLNKQKAGRELALQIAEAGLNYAKWRLAHYPDNLSSEERIYSDPQGGDLGIFKLEFDAVSHCGTNTSINITSVGQVYDYPQSTRILRANYSRPSVAEYAYIIDDNVWAGSDREIKGRYHANGGIRMDGETDSLVTSSKEEWNCTPSFGCSSPYEVKPGIFGDGEGQEQGLWQFPLEPIDFMGISVDLSQMRSLAQASGLYFPPAADFGYSSGRGYHVVFKNDGTFDLYVITGLDAAWGYNDDEDWHWDYHIIDSESFVDNYTLPGSCSLIFIEDDLWVEGEIFGKTTIVSADLINANEDTSVILNNNLTYTTKDGSDGLAIVGEKDVLIPLISPDKMELDGIFLAQKGRFGRNHYRWYYWPWHDRDLLEMHGSVVSKKRVGTQWTSGGSFVSGYRERENTYDRKLMTDPPPLLPAADNEYTFVKWEEVE
ncbi:MAG: hypothetical protein GF387_00225 [Candidatus Portnoybacteria bacterium]|nr:hypothetical protein [Candidatus Portnoybacteria bacterium]